MILLRSFVNYMKRFKQIVYVVPLILFGAAFEMFVMNSGAESMKTDISLKYSQLIVLGNMKNINVKQFAAASTLAYFIIIMCLIIVGFNVSERSSNVTVRIDASPANKLQLHLGYILAQTVVSFFTGACIIAAFKLFFRINLAGNFIGTVLILLLSSFASASFGYFMSSIFSKTKIAIGITVFIIFFAAFLSDTFTLGQSFKSVSKYTINKYIYDCFINFMDGKGLNSCTNNIIILVVFSILCIAIGLAMYERGKSNE